ncbi:MAG: hypothetical protein ACPIOQ_57120, partial [Promethearchaeia archaeon]
PAREGPLSGPLSPASPPLSARVSPTACIISAACLCQATCCLRVRGPLPVWEAAVIPDRAVGMFTVHRRAKSDFAVMDS